MSAFSQQMSQSILSQDSREPLGPVIFAESNSMDEDEADDTSDDEEEQDDDSSEDGWSSDKENDVHPEDTLDPYRISVYQQARQMHEDKMEIERKAAVIRHSDELQKRIAVAAKGLRI
jgi:hypothetical protein